MVEEVEVNQIETLHCELMETVSVNVQIHMGSE